MKGSTINLHQILINTSQLPLSIQTRKQNSSHKYRNEWRVDQYKLDPIRNTDVFKNLVSYKAPALYISLIHSFPHECCSLHACHSMVQKSDLIHFSSLVALKNQIELILQFLFCCFRRSSSRTHLVRLLIKLFSYKNELSKYNEAKMILKIENNFSILKNFLHIILKSLLWKCLHKHALQSFFKSLLLHLINVLKLNRKILQNFLQIQIMIRTTKLVLHRSL